MAQAGRPADGTWGGNVNIFTWYLPQTGVSSPSPGHGSPPPGRSNEIADPRIVLLSPTLTFYYYARIIADVTDAPFFCAMGLTAWLAQLGIIPDEVFLQTGSTQAFELFISTMFGNYWDYESRITPTWRATGGELSDTTGFTTEYTAVESGDHIITAEMEIPIVEPDNIVILTDTSEIHVSATAQQVDPSPADFVLSQNLPNPFSSRTNIRFGVRNPCNVRLLIYDIHGREIARPLDDRCQPGTYRVQVEAAGLAAGTYLYRIEMDGFTSTREMIVIR